MKYRQEYDNKWFYPKRSKWLMRCCDCGLVHRVTFRLEKYGNGKRIAMKVYRLSTRKK